AIRAAPYGLARHRRAKQWTTDCYRPSSGAEGLLRPAQVKEGDHVQAPARIAQVDLAQVIVARHLHQLVQHTADAQARIARQVVVELERLDVGVLPAWSNA